MKQDADWLAAEIKRSHPEAAVCISWSNPGSGAFMIDIKTNGRLYVIEHNPASGEYGVDWMRDDEAFMAGYRHVFTTDGEALACLQSLVSQT